MMRGFVRYVIGGRSGKREYAWAVFLLWAAAFVWVAVKEASGVSMEGSQAILSVSIYPVLISLAAAYGMEWFSTQAAFTPRQSPQGPPE